MGSFSARRPGWRFLIVSVCGAVLAHSSPLAWGTSPERVVVEHGGVRVVAFADGDSVARCRFEVEHRGHWSVNHFTLPDPDRLVVDLKGVRVGRGKVEETPRSRCVSAVRFGIQPDGTRVVFDLRGGAPESYTVAGPERGEGGLAQLSVSFGEPDRVHKSQPQAGDKVGGAPVRGAETPMFSVIVTPTPIPTATSTVAPTATETPAPTPSMTPTRTPALTSTPEPISSPKQAPVAPSALPGVAAMSTARNWAAEGTVTLPAETVDAAALKFRVDKIFVEFGGHDRPVRNIGVTNVATEPIQMTTRVARVMNPGAPNESEEETSDLLVSPRFFALQPGMERQVRIVSTAPADEGELVYRVHLVPQRGEFDPQATLSVGNRHGSVGVVTALAVLVLKVGEGAEAKLMSRREGDTIVLGNGGTRSVFLNDIRRCFGAERSSCRETPGRRLFPGNEWRVDVAPGESLRMLAREGDHFETVSIEGADR